MENFILCGSGKIIKTRYGDMGTLFFTARDIETLKQNLENGVVNCDMKKKRIVKDGGNTHFICVSKYKRARKDYDTGDSSVPDDNETGYSTGSDDNKPMPRMFDNEDIPF